MQDKLLHELLHGGKQASQTHSLRGQLYALVDMGWVSEAVRDELDEQFYDYIYPLLSEREFKKLSPLGAHLIAAKNGTLEAQHALFSSLSRYNSDVVSVWITSVLPPQELCEHLEQAAVAYQEDGKRFLIRYYDPLITPILYGEAGHEWQQWFFSPILSWWFAQVSPQQVQWHRLAGYGGRAAAGEVSTAPKLILSDALMCALEKDPLPFQLLTDIEERNRVVFNTECRNMRLSQVREYVGMAQKQGFTSRQHLLEFTELALVYNMRGLIGHAQWDGVRRAALAQRGSLEALVRQYLMQ